MTVKFLKSNSVRDKGEDSPGALCLIIENIPIIPHTNAYES